MDAPGIFFMKLMERLRAPLALLVLFVCLYYSYLSLGKPKASFDIEPFDWIVMRAPECSNATTCLQRGDRILRIGDISREQFHNDRTLTPFDAFSQDGVQVAVLVERDGRREELSVTGSSAKGKLDPTDLLHLLPLAFWLIGTAAILFVRPRKEQWLVFVMLLYNMTIWGSAGFISSTQRGYSSLVLVIAVWLFVPLITHLHLILPDAPFRKFHRFVLPGLYGACIVGCILDLLHLLPHYTIIWLALLAFIASLGLLTFRLFLPAVPAIRTGHRVMLFGAFIGLAPLIAMTIATLIFRVSEVTGTFGSIIAAISITVVPMWPLSYVYSMCKYVTGTFELRANRLLGTYGFLAVYIYTFVLSYGLAYALAAKLVGESAGSAAMLGLGVSFIFVTIAPWLRPQFQTLVDRMVFGIKYTPSQVFSLFAEKIPQAFNRPVLVKVISEEILPTLLVRASVLYLFGDDKNPPEIIYQQGLPEGCEPLDKTAARPFLEHPLRNLAAGDLPEAYHWAKLVIPLSIQNQAIGLWLLGRRDPDDFYPRSDISLLGNLANQIAPVIEHVRLVERARQEIRENKSLQNQLIHSQKMEAVGRLSAGVAHDFNNLLSVILGYSDLLLLRYGDDTLLSRHITDIRDAGKRAAALTKQLLAFSRQQLMEPKVMSPHNIIMNIEKLLRRVIGEHVGLETKLAPSLFNIRIDPIQMEQVIINLAVNASDAMPEGGRLLIQVRNTTASDDDLREGVPPGDYVVLEVLDSGIGMSSEVCARIFEPFFTTKEVGKGTGLGLSVVYGIINQSSGFIFVESQEGLGTKFIIYLPAVDQEPVWDNGVVVPESLHGYGNGTILVVEDEPDVKRVTCDILESTGFHILAAQDGREAIEIFETYPGRIDLLLTDVVMPVMRGPELARRLLAIRPELKVIFMSGYSDEAIHDLHGDADTILIRKPFTPSSLSQRVRETLESSHVAS